MEFSSKGGNMYFTAHHLVWATSTLQEGQMMGGCEKPKEGGGFCPGFFEGKKLGGLECSVRGRGRMAFR